MNIFYFPALWSCIVCVFYMGYAEIKIGEIPEEGKNLYLFKYFSIYITGNNKAINIPQTQKHKGSRNINIRQTQKPKVT